MVNNIPVNGWPQLKDLEAVQPILNRLDKIEAWKRTVKEETFTGDDITIENALALPARSLITEINAIQDLHGLPFPYVGGAYKNKLKVTATSTTVSGVTFTVNSDGSIKANGTATAQIYLTVHGRKQYAEGSYIFNGCTGGANDTYFMYLSDTRGNYSQYNNEISYTVTDTSGETDCTINIRSGVTVNNIMFYPMLRLSTESDASFAPYSNECPISGRDSVVLTRSDGDEISEDFTIQLGTTVYGAEINWDTGEGWITDIKYVFDGGDADTWNSVSTNVAAKTINGVTCDNTKQPFCSLYNVAFTTTWNNIPNMTLWIYVTATDTYIRVRDDINGATAQSFKSFLASNNLELVLPLATPIPIQLTPTQLEMLKGYNHITLSDGYGTIELKALTGANWS